jgi:hypothetical protein
MCIPLKKSSVNENQTFGGKIRGKIGFLGVKKRPKGWEEKSSNLFGSTIGVMLGHFVSGPITTSFLLN